MRHRADEVPDLTLNAYTDRVSYPTLESYHLNSPFCATSRMLTELHLNGRLVCISFVR